MLLTKASHALRPAALTVTRSRAMLDSLPRRRLSTNTSTCRHAAADLAPAEAEEVLHQESQDPHRCACRRARSHGRRRRGVSLRWKAADGTDLMQWSLDALADAAGGDTWNRPFGYRRSSNGR
jgi:hypothetical protein